MGNSTAVWDGGRYDMMGDGQEYSGVGRYIMVQWCGVVEDGGKWTMNSTVVCGDGMVGHGGSWAMVWQCGIVEDGQ